LLLLRLFLFPLTANHLPFPVLEFDLPYLISHFIWETRIGRIVFLSTSRYSYLPTFSPTLPCVFQSLGFVSPKLLVRGPERRELIHILVLAHTSI
jgi:hypothetical protein